MNAECTRTKLRFQGLDGRDVVGRFDGGEITSDAGGVLLREVEQRTRILGRLSECFTDYRDPDRVEHPVEALIKQRVLGLCLATRTSTTTTSCAGTGSWRYCATGTT